jgi:hypothetical protein
MLAGLITRKHLITSLDPDLRQVGLQAQAEL